MKRWNKGGAKRRQRGYGEVGERPEEGVFWNQEKKQVSGGQHGPQAQRAAGSWMRLGWMESMGCGDLETTAIWQEQMPDGGGDQTGAGESKRKMEAVSENNSETADQRFCSEESPLGMGRWGC